MGVYCLISPIFLIEIKNNSQNQYCLKNIAESDGFQNHPSVGETVKNVVLPLIIELLSKKTYTISSNVP